MRCSAVLLLLVLVCGADFLAVLGKCGETSCRLLYESPCVLELRIDFFPVVSLPPSQTARVHVIDGLEKGKVYLGSVGDVAIRLVMSGGARTKVAFLSCNRGFEDQDFSFYSVLQKAERDLTVHLGDQVYVDSVSKGLRGNETEEQLVETIRNVYRETWRPIKGALLSSPSFFFFLLLIGF
jgi:hypothetical protein